MSQRLESPGFSHEEVQKKISRAIEALLFVTQEPLSIEKMYTALLPYYEVTKESVKKIIDKMHLEYENDNRAFSIQYVAGGYLLTTKPHFSTLIGAILKGKKPERLSQAALETLAIVAYKQPITRQDIESIRGVDSSGVLSHLQERELIEACGKLAVLGKPTLYGTTKFFLKYFGLKDISDLPQLEQT